jgi:hypothetical protein
MVHRAGGVGQTAAARIDGAMSAIFLQYVPVVGGQQYLVTVNHRSRGRSVPYVLIGWKESDKVWLPSYKNRFEASNASDLTQWSQQSYVVTAPSTATKMALELGASLAVSLEDSTWFDDVSVVRVP